MSLTIKYKIAANGFQPGQVVTVEDSAYIRARIGSTFILIEDTEAKKEKAKPVAKAAPAPKKKDPVVPSLSDKVAPVVKDEPVVQDAVIGEAPEEK